MTSPTATLPKRDTFFWLGQINKASIVINADENLLDRSAAPRIARGLQIVLDAGNTDGGPRPARNIDFEPVLIEAAGVEATLIHAGRSSQDMHSSSSLAQIREEALHLAKQLSSTINTMVDLAEEHIATCVPNYTNGVPAQSNSYGHYLLGHVSGLLRDADRLREFYARLNLSPMGSTVLNGTSWPLNRERMSSYLGFAGFVDNAYDAVQIRINELPVELGSVAIAIAQHVGAFIQDIMVQYSQPRPWILLKEGGDNTYVSSAMPQKRNPGLLNNTRAQASHVMTLGIGRAMQAHNMPSGMPDTRGVADNRAVLKGAGDVLKNLTKILLALQINRKRALDELNLGWTASQEIPDVLMREYGVPFRVGHHFASDMVTFSQQNDINPAHFPYTDAQRLYIKACQDMKFSSAGNEVSEIGETLPLGEAALRTTLDPAAVIQNRATAGGPQESEVRRMIAKARASNEALFHWAGEQEQTIESALRQLDADFAVFLRPA